MAPGEARRRAHLTVGGVLATQESASDVWRFVRLETWLRDLHLGGRALARKPVFSLAAVSTFALGIGAATAIFSVAYGVAFRPLPYPSPARLIRLYEVNTASNGAKLQVSQGTFQGWRESVPSLEGLALFSKGVLRYTPGDMPRPITVMSVSPQFFEVLGVAPIRGHGFKREAEYTRLTTNELVLSYDAWQRLFGGAPDIVGQPFQLSERGDPSRIVGVMPRGFVFDTPVDAWSPNPVELPVARIVRSWRFDRVIARLRPGRTMVQLQAELDTTSARLAREFPPSNANWTATAEPLRDAIVGRFGRASWLLLAAVAAVLLVACANVAGLLTARALSRARETSIRMALGAGTWRLVQLWLCEAFVLATSGATMGVAVAWGLVRLLRASAPPGIPRVEDIAIDWPALAVASSATVLSALVCSMAPLVTARDRRLPQGLGTGAARSGDSPRRRRVHTGLVTLQSGAALALVVLSVVFARSFLRLTAVDLGWRPEHVLSLYVAPHWPPENRRPWYLYTQWAERLVARLEATPGIVRAAITTIVPFSPDTIPAPIARGRDKMPDETRWPAAYHVVSDGYFDTMGLTLTRGRRFNGDDRFDEATLTDSAALHRISGVAIVSESVARALWPGQDPIGQALRVPDFDFVAFHEVVGVVADVRFTAVSDEPALDVFLPWGQSPTGAPRLVVRATGDAAASAPAVRAAVLAEHAATGVDRVMAVGALVDRALAPARLTSQLIAALGALALVLAGVGVYGALSTLVTVRTREIAVRLALGAPPGQVLRRTVVQGLWPVALGAVFGVAAAALAITGARSLLFQIEPVDGGAFLTGSLIVLVVTSLACLAPALRAARLDPISVLRGD